MVDYFGIKELVYDFAIKDEKKEDQIEQAIGAAKMLARIGLYGWAGLTGLSFLMETFLIGTAGTLQQSTAALWGIRSLLMIFLCAYLIKRLE